jgi:hypothetical protein
MTCRVSRGGVRHRIPLSSGTQSMWKLTPYRSARTVMRAKSGSPPSLGKDLGNPPQGTVTIVSVRTKSGLSLLFVLWSGRRARLSAIRFRTMRCRICSYTVRFTGGGPGMSSMDSPAIDDTLMIFTAPGGPDRRTSYTRVTPLVSATTRRIEILLAAPGRTRAADPITAH